MTAFKTIRRCFAERSKSHKRSGGTRLLDINARLLLVSFAAFQFFGANACAAPTLIGYGHHTDRFAPNSVPGWPVGDFVRISAELNSTDVPGSPTTVVIAHQDDTTLALDWNSLPNMVYPTSHQYHKLIDFDPSLTGPWEIIPTDITGNGPDIYTNAIAEPEFLPVSQGITLQGTPLGSSVKWQLPNLTGFDVEFAQVRIVQVAPLSEVFVSEFYPVHVTSFMAPIGTLHLGVDYVYSISLLDVEGSYLENRSGALSAPFRFVLPGDFNMDGIVDAADYVVWRKALGTTVDTNDYGVWRTHFGIWLGPGSGSALPSAEPLSTAVPEPASALLLILGTVAGTCRGRRFALRVS